MSKHRAAYLCTRLEGNHYSVCTQNNSSNKFLLTTINIRLVLPTFMKWAFKLLFQAFFSCINRPLNLNAARCESWFVCITIGAKVRWVLTTSNRNSWHTKHTDCFYELPKCVSVCLTHCVRLERKRTNITVFHLRGVCCTNQLTHDIIRNHNRAVSTQFEGAILTQSNKVWNKWKLCKYSSEQIIFQNAAVFQGRNQHLSQDVFPRKQEISVGTGNFGRICKYQHDYSLNSHHTFYHHKMIQILR